MLNKIRRASVVILHTQGRGFNIWHGKHVKSEKNKEMDADGGRNVISPNF